VGLKASFMIAKRSLVRRKTKNLSAILAVTLGVSLLVGIQITTDTLGNAFLTSLLQSEGEVDIRVLNASAGGYLKAADQEKIRALVPAAIGIMPELSTHLPMMIGSQFDPSVKIAGIPSNFPEAFGSFYDWKSGEKIDIGTVLTDNWD
jgi:ABC-type lipoprotein release transport system permease subunit